VRKMSLATAGSPSPSCTPKEMVMANREQRSGREKRKPKAEKPKPPAGQISPFVGAQAGSHKGSGGKKKSR